MQDAIRNRLGWLDAPTGMRAHVATLTALAERARAEGLTAVCLLGMGGSSLCAEVLRDAMPSHRGDVLLTVLDTTDERAIAEATAALTPARTRFLVASKSGTTVEVSSLEQYFRSVTARALGDQAGAHFVAITDPGTPLAAHAAAHGYRETLINPPDIGGRYSALSLFGLTPAALLGLDLGAAAAIRIADGRTLPGDDAQNPGVALGAFMAEQAIAGARQADGAPAARRGGDRSLDRAARCRAQGSRDEASSPWSTSRQDRWATTGTTARSSSCRPADLTASPRRHKPLKTRGIRCIASTSPMDWGRSSSGGSLRRPSPAPGWASIPSTSRTSDRPRRTRARFSTRLDAAARSRSTRRWSR